MRGIFDFINFFATSSLPCFTNRRRRIVFVREHIVLGCLPTGVVVVPRPFGEYLSNGAALSACTNPSSMVLGGDQREGHLGSGLDGV